MYRRYMAQFARTVVQLGGFPGAPGLNVYNWMAPAHLDIDLPDVNNFTEILQTALSDTNGAIFNGITRQVLAETTIHEVETGTLIGAWISETSLPPLTGSGTGDASRATQATAALLTNDIRAGRRVQGRIFFGPIAGGAINAFGEIKTDSRAAIEDSFDGLVDPLGPRLIVWSRPNGVLPGAYADVSSVAVRPRPGVLRSRRD